VLPPQLTKYFGPDHLRGTIYHDDEMDTLYGNYSSRINRGDHENIIGHVNDIIDDHLNTNLFNSTIYGDGNRDRDLYGRRSNTAAYRLGKQCNLCIPPPGQSAKNSCDRVEID
jgi:hypothetical protein